MLSANGAGVAPFIAMDREGTTIISALAAWIKRAPDREFQQEITETTWLIETDSAIVMLGGN